jgi:Tol biopolymer transport system component
MHRQTSILVVAAFAGLIAFESSHAQQPIEGISVNADHSIWGGVQGNERNAISDDGRYVVFSSGGNLSGVDLNGQEDIYVRDRVAGTTILMSIASDGTQANNTCYLPGMSGDGRFVAFTSTATNLTPDPVGNVTNVFLHDRDPDGNGIFDESGATTILLSRKWNGDRSDDYSVRPVISGDGSVVVFESGSNLTPDADGMINLFAWDVAAGTLTCITTGFDGNGSGGDSHNASLSEDGHLVAFESGSPRLIPHDTNGAEDIFLFNRNTSGTTLVSVATDGTQGNDASYDAAISADGTMVAFASIASNLDTGDHNGHADIFVRDRTLHTTTRVSLLPDGTEGNNDSYNPALSQDGRFVAFETWTNNFVPLDQNTGQDVLLLDRATGTFETISADCVGFTANQPSTNPAITPDGRFVTFYSEASNLTDDGLNGEMVYLRDRTISWPTASHATYGAGWPGTLGVPDLTADVDPQYGATVHVAFGNSWGFWTVGFLLVGTSQTSLPTSKDGTLLVGILETMPLALGPDGALLDATIPFDESLCGAEVDLQGIELDPGASKKMAFTAGLQLIVGR